MTFSALVLIAIALSLDAFGVALSIGLNDEVKAKNKMFFSVSFGFFQYLFAFIGAYFGILFSTYIVAIPSIIGGIIIGIVGIIMIKEGMEEKEENFLLKKSMYFILGISVSIDAMVVGFTVLNNVKNLITISEYTIFIGIVTFILSVVAFIISKYLKKIIVVAKYADYIGGIMLILFGLKMIFL